MADAVSEVGILEGVDREDVVKDERAPVDETCFESSEDDEDDDKGPTSSDSEGVKGS